jgi:hypothetical protein
MNIGELAIAYQRPRYLSPLSAWVEHIPFAFLITQLAQPSVFVELGTHLGDSYCAFCQAVDYMKMPSRCTAVDTWRGDAHSGHYDNEALAALRRHHDPLYSSFSRLLQKTFDQAAADFPDGTIDLLHLDGLHTYDAVRHDVDTWLPKLSLLGTLLLHDTRVTRDNFGVHRLWAELSPRYPSFEFHHGSGLGILAVGREPAPNVLQFIEWANADPQTARDFFAALGARLLLARTIARNELLARHKNLSEPEEASINLAPRVAELLDPETDLKEAMDRHTSTMRGLFRRVIRRLQSWSRARGS